MRKSAIREYFAVLLVMLVVCCASALVIKRRLEDARAQYELTQVPLKTLQQIRPQLTTLLERNTARAAELGPVSEFSTAWPKVAREELANVNVELDKLALSKVLAVLDNRPFQVRTNYPLGAEQISVALSTLQVSGQHRAVHEFIGQMMVIVPTARVESMTISSAGGDAVTATMDLIIPLKDSLEGQTPTEESPIVSTTQNYAL